MTILMSAKPPKAEVSLSRFDVRYVPKGDIDGSPTQLDRRIADTSDNAAPRAA
ncbi:MAG: hypothetical protein OER56_14490 [Hyphomicrobiales bacterium]|nr:hypothetical protein [Hyphomicrobiales bacterium]